MTDRSGKNIVTLIPGWDGEKRSSGGVTRKSGRKDIEERLAHIRRAGAGVNPKGTIVILSGRV